MPKNSADSEVSFREYSSSSSNEYDSSFSSEDYELFADCKSKLLRKNWEYKCFSGDRVGKAYRGLASMTRKHKLCRDWNELATWRLQYPHAGLNGAYCRFVFFGTRLSDLWFLVNISFRNPDGDRKGPWCFTIGGSWDHCRIKRCWFSNKNNEKVLFLYSHAV